MGFCVKYKYNEFLCKFYGFTIFAEKSFIMADNLTESQRHYVMSQVHSVSTKPELKLRRSLWRQGFRYRVNDKKLPGKPDIVLPKYRTVIFIHGCFWHGHKGCKNYTIPKTNTVFWVAKVARNQERDQEVWRKLEAKGWAVIIVWECELKKKQFEETVNRVEKEILANGEIYKRHKEERRALREQRQAEIREQKLRQSALMIEIKREP